MQYTITVITPYFIYTSHHTNFTAAMVEFKSLLISKLETKRRFDISIKHYNYAPASLNKLMVA